MKTPKTTVQSVEILAAVISVMNNGRQPSQEELNEIMKCYWNLRDKMIQICGDVLEP